MSQMYHSNIADHPPSDVYNELRNLAYRYLSRERRGHTLQPTALVHEAFLRLRHQKSLYGVDRKKYIGIAARTMRHVLVDHARVRNAQKRGGDMQRVPLDDVLAEYQERAIDIIALHDALEQLAHVDERMVQIVELRFFAGINEEQTAAMMDISPSTVRREWRHAKRWLFNALRDKE